MEAHVIADTEAPQRGPQYIPLTGPEFLTQLKHEISRVLDGEHDLFGIGRAWPRTTFMVEVHLACWGEDEHKLTIQGTTEPPDQVRESLGMPMQSDVHDNHKDEFITTSVDMPGSRPMPIQVKRKR